MSDDSLSTSEVEIKPPEFIDKRGGRSGVLEIKEGSRFMERKSSKACISTRGREYISYTRPCSLHHYVHSFRWINSDRIANLHAAHCSRLDTIHTHSDFCRQIPV